MIGRCWCEYWYPALLLALILAALLGAADSGSAVQALGTLLIGGVAALLSIERLMRMGPEDPGHITRGTTRKINGGKW